MVFVERGCESGSKIRTFLEDVALDNATYNCPWQKTGERR